ncbi:phage adaptor protein [Brucella rhizosphaerae]|uniref:Uncharacterized protein n=1 Tax=Brucella rhizosphaerae TaxID=571254 RepID=A0A256F8I8_9HYPH|nr:hypothetical protein [Brucella rhizosphaerae]OYR11175.1 hypothetical protein CEV32_1473 [Brucella rhizosphaerae]
MAISNYDELRVAISEYARREGDPTFPVDNFISLAEADFRPFIKHYMNEKAVKIDNVTDFIEFPVDMVAPRAVRIGSITPTLVSPYSPSIYPNQIGYFQEGNGYRLVREDYQPVTVTLIYHGSVPALSPTNPTNWLIARFPQVYLSGALIYAHRWLDDVESEQLEKQSLAEAMGRIDEDNRNVQRGGNAVITEGVLW